MTIMTEIEIDEIDSLKLTSTNDIGVVVPSISNKIDRTPTRRDSASSADLFCGAIIVGIRNINNFTTKNNQEQRRRP